MSTSANSIDSFEKESLGSFYDSNCETDFEKDEESDYFENENDDFEKDDESTIDKISVKSDEFEKDDESTIDKNSVKSDAFEKDDESTIDKNSISKESFVKETNSHEKNQKSRSFIARVESVGDAVVHGIRKAPGAVVHGIEHASGAAVHGITSAPSAVVHGIEHASGAVVHGIEHVGSRVVHGIASTPGKVVHYKNKETKFISKNFSSTIQEKTQTSSDCEENPALDNVQPASDTELIENILDDEIGSEHDSENYDENDSENDSISSFISNSFRQKPNIRGRHYKGNNQMNRKGLMFYPGVSREILINIRHELRSRNIRLSKFFLMLQNNRNDVITYNELQSSLAAYSIVRSSSECRLLFHLLSGCTQTSMSYSVFKNALIECTNRGTIGKERKHIFIPNAFGVASKTTASSIAHTKVETSAYHPLKFTNSIRFKNARLPNNSFNLRGRYGRKPKSPTKSTPKLNTEKDILRLYDLSSLKGKGNASKKSFAEKLKPSTVVNKYVSNQKANDVNKRLSAGVPSHKSMNIFYNENRKYQRRPSTSRRYNNNKNSVQYRRRPSTSRRSSNNKNSVQYERRPSTSRRHNNKKKEKSKFYMGDSDSIIAETKTWIKNDSQMSKWRKSGVYDDIMLNKILSLYRNKKQTYENDKRYKSKPNLHKGVSQSFILENIKSTGNFITEPRREKKVKKMKKKMSYRLDLPRHVKILDD